MTIDNKPDNNGVNSFSTDMWGKTNVCGWKQV